MPRSLGSRLVALILAFTAGFVTPVSALAHGYAHGHEAADHGDADHHPAGSEEHLAAEPALVAEGDDHGAGDHPHPNLAAVLTAKSGVSLVALVALRVVLAPAVVSLIAPPEAEVTLEPRASLAHAPPPRLRAPPTVPG